MLKNGMLFHKPAVSLAAIGVFLLWGKGSAFVVVTTQHPESSSANTAPRSTTTHCSCGPLHAHPIRLGSTSQDHERSLHEIDDRQYQKELFVELCDKAEVWPSASSKQSVYLNFFTSDDGNIVRGVYLSQSVAAGETILSVPLSACLRDDEPPEWFDCDGGNGSDNEDDDDDDPLNPCLIAGYYNPRGWATRLAASVIDLKLEATVEPATKLWLSLLPDPDVLRSTLPIHWPTPILQSACCAALELQVDAAFFARAQATQDLLAALSRHPKAQHWDPVRLRRLCDDALDVVQTRSCRVASPPQPEELSGVSPPWAPPLRLLAPVFDFLNHPCGGRPNAEFFLDDAGERLVVRALRDLPTHEEVLIHYGDCTKPASKCLSSYGFVPSFEPRDSGDGDEIDDDDDEIDLGDGPQHVAEVYIDGIRYEVGPETIPEDIVVAMSAEQLETVELTPEIAIRLASRLSDVAYQLLLDPRNRSSDAEGEAETPGEVVSAKLAASLRWNQHRVLLACALGLRDWAVDSPPEPAAPHNNYG